MKIYLKAISSVPTVLLKDHLLRKLLEKYFAEYPEFCVRFVEEYAPQVLEKLHSLVAESKLTDDEKVELKVPRSIKEDHLWKGSWAVSDFDGNVGVPLTQCAIEGGNVWLAKFTTLGRLEDATTYLRRVMNFAEENSKESVEQLEKAFALVPSISNTVWRDGAQCFSAFPSHIRS